MAWKSPRLRFYRDRIEPLDSLDRFRIETPNGAFEMTKSDFYRVFHNVARSRSYLDSGYYHYSSIPRKAWPFLVNDERIRGPGLQERNRMAETSRQTLPSGQIVFDPRGAVTATEIRLAGRPESLRGVRLGVLDNSKWNASRLLRHTAAALDDFEPAAVNRYVKDSFSREATDALLDRIAAENDVVVTAIGD